MAEELPILLNHSFAIASEVKRNFSIDRPIRLQFKQPQQRFVGPCFTPRTYDQVNVTVMPKYTRVFTLFAGMSGGKFNRIVLAALKRIAANVAIAIRHLPAINQPVFAIN